MWAAPYEMWGRLVSSLNPTPSHSAQEPGFAGMYCAQAGRKHGRESRARLLGNVQPWIRTAVCCKACAVSVDKESAKTASHPQAIHWF